jgi:esterase/lipase
MNPFASSSKQIESGDELILFSSGERANALDFDHKNNVILIHGFTAHGKYLSDLARDFNASGFRSYLFNYNSFRGIHPPADTLYSMLDYYNTIGDDVVKNHPVSIIAHSMGGLVARAFTYNKYADRYINKIVTLGTPHNGTLRNDIVFKYFVKWAEHLTEAMPKFRKKTCLSASELTGNDEGKVKVLEALKKPNKNMKNIPLLSVSGGRNWIELSDKNGLLNSLANYRIQKALNGKANDGLVDEQSCNVVNLKRTKCIHKATHHNNYPEFKEINHTNLIYNHSLSLHIMSWLK